MTKTRKVPISHKLLQLLFMLLLTANVFPILWIIVNSLRSDRELNVHPFGWPKTPLWSNYSQAWVSGDLGLHFVNSVVIGLLATLLTMIAGALASFFLSRFEFRAKSFIYALFMLGMLIPIHATLVPLFIEMKNMHLLNERITLLFPYVAFNLPLVIFILVSFMNPFPKDLEEAATIDGAGVMTIFNRVIIPMLRPALVTAFILTFINNWNELSFALVLINDSELKTLPLALASFAGQNNNNFTLQMAGVTIVMVPTILFYVLLQKYLTKGMTIGAVKG